jgi:hypothetical protein
LNTLDWMGLPSLINPLVMDIASWNDCWHQPRDDVTGEVEAVKQSKQFLRKQMKTVSESCEIGERFFSLTTPQNLGFLCIPVLKGKELFSKKWCTCLLFVLCTSRLLKTTFDP